MSEQAILLKMWLTDITPLLQVGLLITWSQGNIAQERIEKLLQTISITFEDGVKRVSNDDDKIIIRDYQLSLEGNVRLKINYLEFTKKCYAICEPSGLEKTSFLKDIQECLVPPFSSSGEISLPKIEARKIVSLFIDQNLYLPAKSSLFEVITLKPSSCKERKDLKSQIIYLFKELNIDKLITEGAEDKGLIAYLDDPNFSGAKLSGGQKKKISIVKAYNSTA